VSHGAVIVIRAQAGCSGDSEAATRPVHGR